MPSDKGKNSRDPVTKTITVSSDEVARERDALLEEMNSYLALVRINGKVRFVYNRDKQHTFYSKSDIATLLENVKAPTAKGGQMPAFDWWLQQPDRREYSGIIFEPDPEKAKRDKYALNLFRGFAVKPEAKERGCDLFYDHLLHNVCQGDVLNYHYLLDTFASWFQRPGVKVPAPVLVGDLGSGKSVVGFVMSKLVGAAYTVTVDKTEQMTGRFNSLFSRAILVLAEEAVFARDLKSQSTIKHLLTGDRLRIELKGLESFEIDSKFNVIFTSNSASVVNASGGERRYFCLQVGNGQQQNADYFIAMKAQLENGGYGALMHDLMTRDISGTNFATPPATALLSKQIIASMTGLERWWSECLAAGELTFTRPPEFADRDLRWPDAEGDGWEVPKAAVVASAADGARDHTGRPASPEAVGRFLVTAVPGLTASRPRTGEGREHRYHLPPLAECREAFVKARPGLLLEDVMPGVRLDTPDDADNADVASPLAPAKRLDAWDVRLRRQGNVVRMQRRFLTPSRSGQA
ncbi:MAG: primase-helicase family protein [Parcubacteria group bacterium]